LSHNLEVSKLLGGLGFWFNSDFSSHVSVLVRLYIAHVSLIPTLILGLLVLHALLVKRHKISPDPRNPDAAAEPVAPFTPPPSPPWAWARWPASACSRCSSRPASARPRWKASRSPSHRGSTGGCSPWRTGSGCPASCGAAACCSRCWSPSRSSTATPGGTGGNA